MGRWAASNDPVLQRYGVGGLARIAVSSPKGFEVLMDTDALKHLIRALGCADAQVRCFAAGAIGAQPRLLSCPCTGVQNALIIQFSEKGWLAAVSRCELTVCLKSSIAAPESTKLPLLKLSHVGLQLQAAGGYLSSYDGHVSRSTLVNI